MDPSQTSFDVFSTVVVNCTGVYADKIRQMDNPDATSRMIPSRGTHLMFDKGMLREKEGVIIPETSDGRLIFVLNWYG